MNHEFNQGTALLAAVLGASLLRTSNVEQLPDNVSARNAREIAVLARVLEKRLIDLRGGMVGSTAAATANARLHQAAIG